MTTNNFYFDNKKEHFPKLHISHKDYITVIKQMFPISLFFQLTMISTLGRRNHSPEQFRQIFTVYLFSYLSRMCSHFRSFFSRFSVIRLSRCAAKLSNRSIHSQWRDQPGAKPAHFKDGRVQFSTEGGGPH